MGGARGKRGTFAVAPFDLNGVSVLAGSMATVDLAISRLSTHTPLALPVRVLHGTRPGPVMFVSACVHGDEIIGVEIIRRLLSRISPKRLTGTLLLIPVVNVLGFIMHQRYLPDRRDLNRSFPGTSRGSLAGQLAHAFSSQIISRCQLGIDIHSAALHRSNLPQIRISSGRPAAFELAMAFGAPAVISAPLRPGSLRQMAAEMDVDVLVYESGEALRFDELAIRVGVKGVLRVMAHQGMLRRSEGDEVPARPVVSQRTHWIRAPQGGIFRATRRPGELVQAGATLGHLADPFGDSDQPVTAHTEGLIIGRSNLPIVNQGDALMHIAQVKSFHTAGERIEGIAEEALSDPFFDEDEIL